eukprot:COSAG05_NODE_15442_length_369_cov_1.040741_1_plen_21_part_01
MFELSLTVCFPATLADAANPA